MNKWKIKTQRPEEIYDSPEKHFTPEVVEKYSSTNAIKKEQQIIAAVIEQLLEISPPAYVLDLGCGPGFSMEYFKNKGYNVVGIDILKEMVEKARKAGLNAILGDMRNLKEYFPASSFDYIVSISAIQWITKNKKHVHALAEGMYYVLKFGGKFGIQFYPKSSEELETVERILKKENFEVEIWIEKPESIRKRRFYIIGKK